MGNSSSTAVDEFKNQVMGCAVFLLAPRFDDKLQFKKPEEITDNVKHALPYATSKDLLAVAKGYYSGGKVSGVDAAIERYITENILDTPEHLTEFLGVLVAKLRPFKRDVESVRSQATAQRQPQRGGSARAVAQPIQEEQDDLTDEEVEALEQAAADELGVEGAEGEIGADEFESEEQAERYLAWQHARKLGLQLQSQQATARAELHNARATSKATAAPPQRTAQLESVGAGTLVASAAKHEVNSQSSRRSARPATHVQMPQTAPAKTQAQSHPQQAAPVAEPAPESQQGGAKPSAFAVARARARAQARAAGVGAKIGGQIDKKLQQLDTTITKARGTTGTAPKSKKPEIDINDLLPPKRTGKQQQAQEEQETADGEYDQQSYAD